MEKRARATSEQTASRAYSEGLNHAYMVYCSIAFAAESLIGLPLALKIALFGNFIYFWIAADERDRYITIGHYGKKICYKIELSDCTRSLSKWETYQTLREETVWNELRVSSFFLVIATAIFSILLSLFGW